MKIAASALSLCLLAAAPSFAAEVSAVLEEAVKANHARKLQSAARLVGLEGEAKKDFDGLYAEFQDSLLALNEKYADFAYRLLERSTPTTIEEVRQVMREYRDLEVKKLDLREFYFDKFAKILEPAQLVRLFQLENKADTLLRHEVGMQVGFRE